MLDRGVPLNDVQYLMGHKDPKVTQRYGHPAAEAASEGDCRAVQTERLHHAAVGKLRLTLLERAATRVADTYPCSWQGRGGRH